MQIHELPGLSGQPAAGDVLAIEHNNTTYKIDYNALALAIWLLNTPVPITQGGSGGTTAAQARTNLGITPANIGAFGAGSVPAVTDANDTTLYGCRFFQASACANLPTSGSTGQFYFVIFMGTAQLAIRVGNDGPLYLHARYYLNSQWSAWKSATLS